MLEVQSDTEKENTSFSRAELSLTDYYPRNCFVFTRKPIDYECVFTFGKRKIFFCIDDALGLLGVVDTTSYRCIMQRSFFLFYWDFIDNGIRLRVWGEQNFKTLGT